MKSLCFIVVILPMALYAMPIVESVKTSEVERNASGEITVKHERINYKGGWIQIVISFFKEDGKGKTVMTYNEKGEINGLDMVLEKSSPPWNVAEGRELLASNFLKLTTKEYVPEEFNLTEGEDGRSLMIWNKKHEGRKVYAYLEAYRLGCGTQDLVEAAKKGLIPK
jgi:hypothetical protein